MKLHPRHELMTAAKIDIDRSITDAVARHTDLTHAELIAILLSNALSWNRFAIRDEREADPGKPTANTVEHAGGDK